MITNKYESPPNYQSLKEQRLRQIQEDYFPPPYKNCFDKFFSARRPIYTNTANYAPEYNSHFSPAEVFEVKNSVASNITGLVFSLLFIASPLLSTIPEGKPEYFLCISSLVGLWIAINCIKNIADKTAKLTITDEGLHFIESNTCISWGQVIANHILEDQSGEDTTYKLVTDYVDSVTGKCCTEFFTIEGYDKKTGDIVLAINWYHQQYMQQQMITQQ